jgi:hypothetical protein
VLHYSSLTGSKNKISFGLSEGIETKYGRHYIEMVTKPEIRFGAIDYLAFFQPVLTEEQASTVNLNPVFDDRRGYHREISVLVAGQEAVNAFITRLLSEQVSLGDHKDVTKIEDLLELAVQAGLDLDSLPEHIQVTRSEIKLKKAQDAGRFLLEAIQKGDPQEINRMVRLAEQNGVSQQDLIASTRDQSTQRHDLVNTALLGLQEPQ